MEAKLYQALSKKLGWDDMLIQIACPAIDRIISNRLRHINDRTSAVLAPETVAASLLQDSWTPDDIFSLLVSPDYQEWMKEKDLFTSLRFEIEDFMRRGNTCEVAISEWYK